ncbi:ribbon-helix-helix domain-containing protein [Candidatus Fukatsuia symbiotica]|uniref:ribbon-helix-helix domain-containing protein n=1 Tax=Candidatus Fukatsuia symbiotica TaxID=1878942 RepID=UPI001F08452D|nr:ribbon-helix-helix domain-containing protein [Candidatus Fukatsuia symbiotica]MEA9446316.1 ribbon-helix-helix domain-containing protein [Candidatus Fukatsuia symbiotica]
MLAIPLPVEIEDRLDQLAEMTGKTTTLLAKQAINEYLERELWQITETEHALN